MGRYDGEDYEPVPTCPSGQHMPVPNGTCHVCRIDLTPKQRRDGEQFHKVRNHQRRGCPEWCDGTPEHRFNPQYSGSSSTSP